MKKSTKTIMLSIAMCLIMALGVFCVLAASTASLNAGGRIRFVAPGVSATISAAELTGIDKESGSGTMSTFTTTSEMTTAQIEALSGYKTWSGLILRFTDESEGVGKISFTITNNSSKATEHIMVELSTNSTESSPIVATPAEDFCIAPGANHTFDINLNVPNQDETITMSGFEMTITLTAVKPAQVTSIADQASENGLVFTPNSATKTATLTGYTTPTAGASALAQTGLSVEIPALVKDATSNIYTVTEIGAAFDSVKTTLSSITIPNTVTTIAANAFKGCTALTGDLIIPRSVSTIGDSAFEGCTGLDGDIVISSTVENMGQKAFSSCSNLNSIIVKAPTPPDVLANIFDDTNECPIFVTATKVNEYKNQTNWSDYSDRIYAIGEDPFPKFLDENGLLTDSNDTKYTGVIYQINESTQKATAKQNPSVAATNIVILRKVIYNNVKYTVDTIADNGFKSHSTLTTISMPNTLVTIGDSAFYDCRSIQGEIVIPDSVKTIGNSAFSNCSGQEKTLKIGNGVETIGGGAFCFSGFEGDLVIPSSVKTIGEGAFFDNAFSGDLVIPASLESVDETAFGACGGFDSITVENGNQNYYSKNNCLISKQDKILILGCDNSTIPQNEGLTKICDHAFESCDGITGQLNLPSTLTIIGESAFSGCTGLTGEWEIPTSVEDIGSGAFCGCSGLTGNLVIPSFMTAIPSDLFSGCTGLTGDLVIPNTIEYIGENSFGECTGFTSLTLNEGLTSIGSYAFAGCEGLTGNLVIPDSVVEIYYGAFLGCCGLDGNLTIGSGVEYIAEAAFAYTSFASIKIYATTPPTIEEIEPGSVFYTEGEPCAIYVPADSEGYYLDDEYWSVYADRIHTF